MKAQPNNYDFIGASLQTKALHTINMAYSVGRVKSHISKGYYNVFTGYLTKCGFAVSTIIPGKHVVFVNELGNKIKVIAQ